MEEIKSDKLAPASSFTVTDPRESVKVFKSANEIFPREFLTIPELFSKTVADFGDHTALMYKKEGSSEWTPINYSEYKRRVEQVAKAFIKLGLENHGSVAVLANNCVEWFLSFLGAIHAG
jgi:acyl-CoA synthetase (AMP-forming)/AMP-acid ligase II